MKGTRKFFAGLLALMLMFSLLPMSAMAANQQGASSQSGISISSDMDYAGGTLSLSGTASSGTVYVAGYSDTGRMVAAVTGTINNNGSWTANLAVGTADKISRVKAFLLDGSGNPVAEANGFTEKIVTAAGEKVNAAAYDRLLLANSVDGGTVDLTGSNVGTLIVRKGGTGENPLTIRSGSYDTVYISSGVADGTVVLDGVTAKNLIVCGGGSNSIELTDGTQVTAASVEKDTGSGETPRLAVDGTSGVGTVDVSGKTIIPGLMRWGGGRSGV